MKLQSYLLGTAILCLTYSLNAQDFNATEKHFFSDEFIVPNYIEFSKDEMPRVDQLNDFLIQYWKGKEDFDLRLKDRFEDTDGEVHLKYVQTYKGVDIEFAEWIVHEKNGAIRAMNGKLITEYPAVSEAGISEAAALEAALNRINADTYKWELPGEEAFLQQLESNPNATYFPTAELSFMSSDLDLNPSSLRLCYKFNIYAHEPMSRQEMYVDAINSEIVFSNNLIHTANVPGTAYTAYSGVQTITTDSFAVNRYSLNQTALGNGVNTYDLNNGTNFGSAVNFVDSNNVWNQINAQKNQYATDAHWGAEQTYKYLSASFNRNSINNNGFALNSYVHYGNNYVNAFWNGQYMTYGDGNANVSPLTALDVAGHEIAHGLTTFTANLIYQRESGALNESFSDIFGTAIEFFSRPNGTWTIGEDMNFIIRSMSNPKQYGDPDTYDGANWLNQVGCVPSNQNDNCGVHINSGVQNHWFYLISAGGSGTNDKNNTYSVSSIGITKAAAIAYRNLTVYLGRNSDYNEARYYAIRSAIDLYGACSPEVEAVTKAWYAVGVGANYVNSVVADYGSSDSSACLAPLTVSFFNESANGISFIWDFGDGSSSTSVNPIHTYTTQGQFDVTLFVNGGSCGNDTLKKIAYVDIDTANSCVAILNNGTNPTQTDCTGKIFDSGGSNGTYSNNETGILTIDPAGANSVTLSFVSFDVEAGSTNNLCDYDYLEIFDGGSVNDPLIGRYCNNIAPPSTISSTRGPITLRFSTDGAVNQAGFEIDWACSYPSAAPSANFQWDTDTTCTGVINFTDKSTQAPNAWFWDFGDGNTSTLRDPSHTYTADGNYSVQLRSVNTFGSDSILKSNIIYVDRPVGPAVTNDTVCVGQPASLSASGNGRLDWYTNQVGGTQVNTGATFSLNQPLNDTTFWVEDYIRPATQITGPPSNSFGTGGNYNGDQYLIFDVYKTIILTDVFVYANGNGIRTIELRDNNGTVLQSKTLNVTNGLFNVDLDFLIEPGIDYQLGVDFQGTGPNFYRNNSGASYPYTSPGLLSIKRSSATTNPTGFYYFFYYWRIKEPDCVSPRVPVTAKSDPNCVTSIEENSIADAIQLYPNPATEAVELFVPSHDGNLEISLWNIEGKKVKDIYHSVAGSNGLQRTIDISELPKGVYLARIMAESKSKTIRLVIL